MQLLLFLLGPLALGDVAHFPQAHVQGGDSFLKEFVGQSILLPGHDRVQEVDDHPDVFVAPVQLHQDAEDNEQDRDHQEGQEDVLVHPRGDAFFHGFGSTEVTYSVHFGSCRFHGPGAVQAGPRVIFSKAFVRSFFNTGLAR